MGVLRRKKRRRSGRSGVVGVRVLLVVLLVVRLGIVFMVGRLWGLLVTRRPVANWFRRRFGGWFRRHSGHWLCVVVNAVPVL